MLAGSRAVVREGEELSEIEKAGLEGLTAKEAMERKAELAKIRALQTYQEAKYRRQGKIKSKKYRKIARKEREKEKLQVSGDHHGQDDSDAAGAGAAPSHRSRGCQGQTGGNGENEGWGESQPETQECLQIPPATGLLIVPVLL